MRYNLLEATQYILSSMDSDEVNSYDDTVESLQVARLLKSVYYDLATDLDLPEHETLLELDASGSSSQPVLMTVPSTVTRLNWIKYNNKLSTETNSNYKEVVFLPFQEFFDRQSSLYLQTANVAQMSFTNNAETFELMYWTNRMPLFYTSIDDYTLLFDGLSLTEDTTLQKSKTMCHGSVYPTFTLSNTFTPDLDPTQFSLWLNTAKVRAFSELKQLANVEAASHARRQKIVAQRTNRRVPDLAEVFKVPRYGRTGSSASGIAKNLRNGT